MIGLVRSGKKSCPREFKVPDGIEGAGLPVWGRHVDTEYAVGEGRPRPKRLGLGRERGDLDRWQGPGLIGNPPPDTRRESGPAPPWRRPALAGSSLGSFPCGKEYRYSVFAVCGSASRQASLMSSVARNRSLLNTTRPTAPGCHDLPVWIRTGEKEGLADALPWGRCACFEVLADLVVLDDLTPPKDANDRGMCDRLSILRRDIREPLRKTNKRLTPLSRREIRPQL